MSSLRIIAAEHRTRRSSSCILYTLCSALNISTRAKWKMVRSRTQSGSGSIWPFTEIGEIMCYFLYRVSWKRWIGNGEIRDWVFPYRCIHLKRSKGKLYHIVRIGHRILSTSIIFQHLGLTWGHAQWYWSFIFINLERGTYICTIFSWLLLFGLGSLRSSFNHYILKLFSTSSGLLEYE